MNKHVTYKLFRCWVPQAKSFIVSGIPGGSELHTTLFDINGEGIYEGDKVLIKTREAGSNKPHKEYFTGVVKFVKGTFQVIGDKHFFTLSALSEDATAEVIGNIHQ